MIRGVYIRCVSQFVKDQFNKKNSTPRDDVTIVSRKPSTMTHTDLDVSQNIPAVDKSQVTTKDPKDPNRKS